MILCYNDYRLIKCLFNIHINVIINELSLLILLFLSSNIHVLPTVLRSITFLTPCLQEYRVISVSDIGIGIGIGIGLTLLKISDIGIGWILKYRTIPSKNDHIYLISAHLNGKY